MPAPIRRALSGALSGILATTVFTVVHELLISDIWFSFVPMAVAGAVCGGCLGGAYAVVSRMPTARGWLQFNLVYVALFVLLGAASLAVFEPITTAAAVLEADQPPAELFSRSLPFMIVSTVVATGALLLVYGPSVRNAIALLVTTAVLMAALGMNVGIFGLVAIPTSALPLIGMLFALIAVLAAANAAAFAVIERRWLVGTGPAPPEAT